jgi:hypothetical protein
VAVPPTRLVDNAPTKPRRFGRAVATVHGLFRAMLIAVGLAFAASNHDVQFAPGVKVRVDVAVEAFGTGVGTVANAGLAIRGGRALFLLA